MYKILSDLKHPELGALTVSGKIKKQILSISITNAVKQEHSCTRSNNIGLNNVQKMTKLLGSEIKVEEKDGAFTVILSLPLQ